SRKELDRRRAGPDDAYSFSRELDALLRPRTGVHQVPLERVESGYVRPVGRGQEANSHHAVATPYFHAPLSGQGPAAVRSIERSGRDACVELDATTEVESISDPSEIAENVRLLRISRRPSPFLLQFVREGIRVLEALDVDASARIPIPIPSAAYIFA